MFVIGISGGIGCGKTSVADFCREAELPVLDADVIAHEVSATGGSALDELRLAFGEEFFTADGSLDRHKMAALAFHDKKSLDRLSLIIHREVFKTIDMKLKELQAQKVQIVFLDVPIPVRNGFLDHIDQLWIVWADDSIRLERLEKRGMPRGEALRRIAMQMSREEYTGEAKYVLSNNGELQELRVQVAELFEKELRSRGIQYKPLLSI